MNRTILAVVATAAVAGILGWGAHYVAGGTAAPTADMDAMKEEIAALRADIDRMYGAYNTGHRLDGDGWMGYRGWTPGTVTKNIDGHTIEVDGITMRLPLVEVENSGDRSARHAAYARELCPVGTDAMYRQDSMQTDGFFGRMIASVYCINGHLDSGLIGIGLGWIDTDQCGESEYAYSDWAINDCRRAASP